MKQVLTKEEVAKAIQDLEAQGKKVTCTSLHAALGNRGSMSTLLKLKADIQGTPAPVVDSPQGLKAFREVWVAAVAEGRQQNEATIAQLREELKALATENERLDGMALEFKHVKDQAESERERAVAELKVLQTDLIKSAEQTKQLLSTLAEERSAHAKEIGTVRQELAGEVRKFHELELKLARSENSSNEPAKPRGRKAFKEQRTGAEPAQTEFLEQPGR